MTSTALKVQNGVIFLPERLRSAWRDAEIQVTEYGNKIVLEGPAIESRTKSTMMLSQLQKLAGIWKDRVMPDPVEWQREIRKEWDRPLP